MTVTELKLVIEKNTFFQAEGEEAVLLARDLTFCLTDLINQHTCTQCGRHPTSLETRALAYWASHIWMYHSTVVCRKDIDLTIICRSSWNKYVLQADVEYNLNAPFFPDDAIGAASAQGFLPGERFSTQSSVKLKSLLESEWNFGRCWRLYSSLNYYIQGVQSYKEVFMWAYTGRFVGDNWLKEHYILWVVNKLSNIIIRW